MPAKELLRLSSLLSSSVEIDQPIDPPKPLNLLARPKGFEPLAFAFGGQRSIQLSYGRLVIGLADFRDNSTYVVQGNRVNDEGELRDGRSRPPAGPLRSRCLPMVVGLARKSRTASVKRHIEQHVTGPDSASVPSPDSPVVATSPYCQTTPMRVAFSSLLDARPIWPA